MNTPILNSLARVYRNRCIPLVFALALACTPSRPPTPAHCIDDVTKKEVPEHMCAPTYPRGGVIHPMWIYGGNWSPGGYYTGGGSYTPLYSTYSTPSGRIISTTPNSTIAPRYTGGTVSNYSSWNSTSTKSTSTGVSTRSTSFGSRSSSSAS